MKVKEISAGLTINLGNYESLRLEMTVETEAYDQVVDELLSRLREDADHWCTVNNIKHKSQVL